RTVATILLGNARRKQGYLESECTQQSGEGAVHLVTEPAAVPLDTFANETILLADDLPPEANVEILKRHAEHVRTVQATQRLGCRRRHTGVANASQVCSDVEHGYSILSRLPRLCLAQRI